MLDKEGMGFKFAMEGLDGGRVSCTAISTGIAEHALDIAKNYALERVAFGKPIAKHQAIAFKIADMAMYIEAMKLMLYDVAEMKASGVRCSVQAAEAKLFACIPYNDNLSRCDPGIRRKRLQQGIQC